MWSATMLWLMQTAVPAKVLRPGDVVTVVEIAPRQRYVVRTAQIRPEPNGAATVPSFELSCTFEDDQRHSPACDFLSTVNAAENAADDSPDNPDAPAIVAKGAFRASR